MTVSLKLKMKSVFSIIGISSSSFLIIKLNNCISPSMMHIIINLTSLLNIPGFGIVINNFFIGFVKSE